jgi:hypothetical protein
MGLDKSYGTANLILISSIKMLGLQTCPEKQTGCVVVVRCVVLCVVMTPSNTDYRILLGILAFVQKVRMLHLQ